MISVSTPSKKKTRENGYWKNSDLTPEEVIFNFSEKAQKEVESLVRSLPKGVNIEDIDIHRYDLSQFKKEIFKVREDVDFGIRFGIFAPIEALNPLEHKIVVWLIGTILGRPLEQALDGGGNLCTKLYPIFYRGGVIEEGARYSYSNQGGDSHTDNVNTEEIWEYLLLLSVFPAMAGGGNTLVSGLTLHEVLKSEFPDQLEVLKRPFLWERKGIGDNTFYKAPVVTYNAEGEPLFRWLPRYATLSNKKAVEMGFPGAKSLTKEERQAFDLLTSLTQSSNLQFQGELPPRHILITNDSQVFHEREHFADYLDACIPELNDLNYNPKTAYGRLRYRLWIQKEAK